MKSFSHIKFGFRGEGILYKLNGKEYEIGSTWVEGLRIYFDDLRNTGLNETQKTMIFEEIVQFVNHNDSQKPIICFTSDYDDAALWKKLAKEFYQKINGIEVTTIKEQNKALYKSMVEDLETGKCTHIFPNGLVIKSKKYLDKHWDFIKIQKENNTKPSISLWNKLLAKLNI
ncbi:MAG: hypothetical protein AAFU57_17630 [Bacteroidota bacterium]